MATEKNGQKVEHELWRTSFYLHELQRSKEVKRWNPLCRAYLQQLLDITREAAECAHQKRDFAVECSIYVQEDLNFGVDRFDDDCYHTPDM